ncbi:MAG: hypothetical protein EBZ13_10245, partial [Planctomycetia bacterium]|nr:hypothetical protein [Planctomycetia bacterium]
MIRNHCIRLLCVLVTIWLVGLSPAIGRAEQAVRPVSFNLDVIPILSKAGCNGGGCHGALAGKGGFRLSLFGYDPASDYLTITRDARGRRIDFSEPGASLLLTKPTTAVAHKGGKRLDLEGDDYNLLAAWIAAGCPGPQSGEKTLVGIAMEPAEAVATKGDTVTFQV